MPNESRKHHYVPQSLLRNFSIAGAHKQVHVFDKHTERSFLSSIGNAGAERDFNRVLLHGMDVNYEPAFQQLDDLLALLVSRIVQVSSLSCLSSEEQGQLSVLAACQMVRTKLYRTSPVEVSRQLSEWVEGLGFPAPTPINDSDARLIALEQLARLEDFAEVIAEKDAVLLVSEETNLWISDNPVVLYNTFPAGRPALTAPGVEIYYPLSTNLCLAFLCPSIREILMEARDPQHPRPMFEDPFFSRLLEGLIEQRSVEISKSSAASLNSMQVSSSSRFLYSAVADFELAKRIVNENPTVREVKSLMTLGSTPSPPAADLPPGNWLVIESGCRCSYLEITLVETNSKFIDFRTTDHAKLTMVMQDQRFDSVTLYENCRATRSIRNVVIIALEMDGCSFFRVQFAASGLNAIL